MRDKQSRFECSFSLNLKMIDVRNRQEIHVFPVERFLHTMKMIIIKNARLAIEKNINIDLNQRQEKKTKDDRSLSIAI